MIQINIFDYLYPPFKIKTPIRLIELFAGVGSQAMALRDIGADFEHYRVVEFDKFAIRSYNAIHGTNFKTMDIRDIHADDIGICEKQRFTYLLTYSFPCQDLSKTGKQKGMSKGSGTRSGLLWEVERILLELKEKGELPQVLLMENVPDVIGNKNYADFMEWYSALEEMGYQSYYKILNAKNYGIPQNRERCFMVSILGKYSYQFPKKNELKWRLKDMLEDTVDEKYYLSDRALSNFTSDVNRNGFIRSEKFRPHDIDDTYAYSITSACNYRVSDNFIKIQEASKKGYSEAEPGDSVNLKQPHSKTRRGRVGKGIVQTLTTSCDHGIIEPAFRIRRLTPLECWRLMGFTDEDFKKAQQVNSNSQLYKQAGNSIVKQVLMAIFKEMMEGMNSDGWS